MLAATPAAEGYYDIERILKHSGVNHTRKYLVRWKGYGPEFDEWVSQARVTQAAKEEYLYSQEFRDCEASRVAAANERLERQAANKKRCAEQPITAPSRQSKRL